MKISHDTHTFLYTRTEHVSKLEMELEPSKVCKEHTWTSNCKVLFSTWPSYYMVRFPKTDLPTTWLSTSTGLKRWESQRSSVIYNRSTLVIMTILHDTICRHHKQPFQILLILNDTRVVRSSSFISMFQYSCIVDVWCWQQCVPMHSVCYLI